MITLQDISMKGVLSEIHLTLEPGDCLCITGSNEKELSALLDVLIGEQKPTDGQMMVDEVNLYALPEKLQALYRRNLGVLRKEHALLADRSIASNVALGLELRGVNDSVLASRTVELLETIDLLEKATLLPHHVTEGERRRISLAQAIAHDPMIMIAEEPVHGLDAESQNIILNILKELHRAGTTMIIITQTPERFRVPHTRVIKIAHGKMTPQKKSTREKTPQTQTVTLEAE